MSRVSFSNQSRNRLGRAGVMVSFLPIRFTSEHQLLLLNSDELRSKNREQLIEKLERVIQEKNASIDKLEQRLEDTLNKRNSEFRALEEQLRQYEDKVCTFLSLLLVLVTCSIHFSDAQIRTAPPAASSHVRKDNTGLSE